MVLQEELEELYTVTGCLLFRCLLEETGKLRQTSAMADGAPPEIRTGEPPTAVPVYNKLFIDPIIEIS